MSCPNTHDMCRVRGDTYSFTIKITSNGSTPIDISTFSYLLTVDPSEEPADNLNNLFQLVGTITDGPGGIVSWDITAGEADQTPGIYFYDIQQTDGSGKITTILKGRWEVVQDITK